MVLSRFSFDPATHHTHADCWYLSWIKVSFSTIFWRKTMMHPNYILSDQNKATDPKPWYTIIKTVYELYMIYYLYDVWDEIFNFRLQNWQCAFFIENDGKIEWLCEPWSFMCCEVSKINIKNKHAYRTYFAVPTEFHIPKKNISFLILQKLSAWVHFQLSNSSDPWAMAKSDIGELWWNQFPPLARELVLHW